MEQKIQEAISKGFSFVQDSSTNNVHAATTENKAICNKRFDVFKIATETVREFWCPKCITKIEKEAN